MSLQYRTASENLSADKKQKLIIWIILQNYFFFFLIESYNELIKE